jgi:hypothetical protein
MKLFQQLLVAPAALGLLSPVVVQAAELNIDGVNRYASEEQVTSIDQFSDVKPTDWAYQALSNLIERYGCVAGYPNGTYKGGQAMTRYEAAALLNACLDRITEVTDELKRLMAEFEKELAVLRGRVDGLEAKVGELEATQFSTTTKLTGKATFVLGANSYGGDARVSPTASFYTGIPVLKASGAANKWKDSAKATQGATVFNYDLQLNFDTSFTGKDLLRTRLRAGNFGSSAFGNVNANGQTIPTVGLNALEAGFEGAPGADTVMVNRLFYQFPIGSSFTATIGGRVRQDDMLAVWPSAYPADTILDIFTYAGAPGAYNLNLGGGAGLWWKTGNWSVSVNYVSANSGIGAPTPSGTFAGGNGDCLLSTIPTGGIGNSCSAQTGTAQIAYSASNWGLAAAYTYSSGGAGLYSGNGTSLAFLTSALASSTSSVGVSGYWQPTSSGWIPSISAGWGINTNNFSSNRTDALVANGLDPIKSATSQSWYVGLQWDDVFIKGNSAGMAVGQATFLTNLDLRGSDPNTYDGNYAWEWWYKFQVTDNISVTPALYYLSAPAGQLSKNVNDPAGTQGSSFTNFGGLIKTTFKF